MISAGQQQVRGGPGRGRDFRRRCDDSVNGSGNRVWRRPAVPPDAQLPSMFAAAASVTPRRPSSKSEAKKNPSIDARIIPASTATAAVHASAPADIPTPTTSKAVIANAASTRGFAVKKKKKDQAPVMLSTPKSEKPSLLSNRRDWSTPEKDNISQWKPQSPAPATPSTVASSASYFSPTSGNNNTCIGSGSPVARTSQQSPSPPQRRYLGAPTPKSGKKSKVLSVFSKIPKRNTASPRKNENGDGGGGVFNLITPQERIELARAFHAMEEEKLLEDAKPIDVSLAEDAMEVLRNARNENEFVEDEESSLSLSSDSDCDDDESVDV